MSWRDRPYSDESDGRPELRLNFRKPSTLVGWLIAANIAIFFVDAIAAAFPNVRLSHLFGLSLGGLRHLYFWQPVSYMFMHADAWHLLMNMLGLYIFGSEFERSFGRQRFAQFYGTCGVVGGLAYLALSAWAPHLAGAGLVGASGAVYGLLIAAVIFFPHIQVVLIIFPMPIRVFGAIVGAILLLQALSGQFNNPGGEACHVAGALTGIGMFYAWGMMPRVRVGGSGPGLAGRIRQGAWERKLRKLAVDEAEVDRILDKVHRQGVGSLTRTERKLLAKATRRQQEMDRASRL